MDLLLFPNPQGIGLLLGATVIDKLNPDIDIKTHIVYIAEIDAENKYSEMFGGITTLIKLYFMMVSKKLHSGN